MKKHRPRVEATEKVPLIPKKAQSLKKLRGLCLFFYMSLLQNSIYNVIHPIYSVVD